MLSRGWAPAAAPGGALCRAPAVASRAVETPNGTQGRPPHGGCGTLLTRASGRLHVPQPGTWAPRPLLDPDPHKSRKSRKEKHQRRPVSRVLSPGRLPWPRVMVISLGRRLPGASSGLTRERHAGHASPAVAGGIALLFGLAPGGVYRASPVTRAAGGLLPHRFTLTARRCQAAVCFLWHWSVGLPPLAVSQHPALRSPDFPPARLPAPATIRPSLVRVETAASKNEWEREKYSTPDPDPRPAGQRR